MRQGFIQAQKDFRLTDPKTQSLIQSDQGDKLLLKLVISGVLDVKITKQMLLGLCSWNPNGKLAGPPQDLGYKSQRTNQLRFCATQTLFIIMFNMNTSLLKAATLNKCSTERFPKKSKENGSPYLQNLFLRATFELVCSRCHVNFALFFIFCN